MLNFQPESGCSWYLIKLSGLPVEFGAVVLARNHQYGVGHIHRLLRGHLQVLLWAVPQSVLPGMGWGWVRTGRSLCLTLALPKGSGPAGGGGGSDSRGHEEWGTHRSVHSGVQVINPTDQEKACEGEEQSARWTRWGQPRPQGQRGETRGGGRKRAGHALFTGLKAPSSIRFAVRCRELWRQRGSSGPVGEGGGCPARLQSLWEPLKLGVTPRSVQLARSITAARWAPAECVRTGKSPWDGSEQRAGLVLFAHSVGPGSRRPSLPSAPQARRAARLHKGLDPLPSHPAPPDGRRR